MLLRAVVFHYRSKNRTNPTTATDSTSYPEINRLETVHQCDASGIDHHTNTEDHENDIASLCKA